MKLGIIGCLAGSAAALLVGGCTAEPYATTGDVYRGAYAGNTVYESQPTFVERRTVFIDRQPRTVAVYRTGGDYFYNYGGHRYTVAGYPAARRTTIVERPGYASSTTRYSRYTRGPQRSLVRTGYTEDESTAFRREDIGATVLSAPNEGGPVYRTTRRTYDTAEAPIGERVEIRDTGTTTRRVRTGY